VFIANHRAFPEFIVPFETKTTGPAGLSGRATAGEDEGVHVGVAVGDAVGVLVGEGVSVGEGVIVGEGVSVGEGVIVGEGVSVGEGVIVGVGEGAAMLLILIPSPKLMRGITSFESYDRSIRQCKAGDGSSKDKVLRQFIIG
jgi:hypothetical protein